MQREHGVLLDVNTGNCEIHLIRCSPFGGRKTLGISDSDMWNKQVIISSVLCSFRLILELLDKGEVLHTPDETMMLDQNSRMHIYYISYSRGRVGELKEVRGKLVKQHRADFSRADRPQAAPPADAQPNSEEARHGAQHYAHHKSRVDQSARQSQKQQQPQGGSSGTASAQADDIKQNAAARGLLDLAAAAVSGRPSGRPSGQGIAKSTQIVSSPFQAAKGAKVSVKPPERPQLPQARASR